MDMDEIFKHLNKQLDDYTITANDIETEMNGIARDLTKLETEYRPKELGTTLNELRLHKRELVPKWVKLQEIEEVLIQDDVSLNELHEDLENFGSHLVEAEQEEMEMEMHFRHCHENNMNLEDDDDLEEDEQDENEDDSEEFVTNGHPSVMHAMNAVVEETHDNGQIIAAMIERNEGLKDRQRALKRTVGGLLSRLKTLMQSMMDELNSLKQELTKFQKQSAESEGEASGSR